ncbi:MAG TPA: hypothetical protein VGO22_06800 [Pseudorhizobium sp.]|nr:hypothetical protein [Pseudorhizobium sp.]
MADFVAVIRRAVDGLAKNTPEMREKVYDKARGAVRRQLENMKPAPPDSMIHRQMEKLESAILSVEAEHAEALPAEETAVAPIVAPEPDYEEPLAEEAPGDGYEPASAVQAQWPEESADEPSPDVYAVPQEPEAVQQEHAAYHEETYPEPEPAHEAHSEQAYDHAPIYHEEPVEDAPYGAPYDAAPEGPATVSEEAPEDAWQPRNEPEPYAAVGSLDHHVQEPTQEEQLSPEPIGLWPTSEAEHAQDGGQAFTSPSVDEAAEPTFAEAAPATTEVADTPSWDGQPEAATPVQDDAWQWPEELDPRQEVGAWNDVPDLTPTHAPSPAQDAEAHFEEQTYASAASVRMPSTEDFPIYRDPAAGEEPNPQEPLEAAMPGEVASLATSAAPATGASKDPWEDIEELIGYNQSAMPAGRAEEDVTAADGSGDMVPPPPRPYRVAPKKRNYTAPILAAIGFIVLAAGGYALWLNRDSLIEVVGVGEPPAETAPSVEPVEGAVETAAPEPEVQAPEAETAAENGTTAPAGEEVDSSKFTQRLLPDGTEVDEGAGPVDSATEGQSVAQLNAPPAAPAEAGNAAGEETQAAPTATPADAAALSGQKMFLYEERVGQTAPTAIEGAVSWSLQREANSNGVQEPVVQGRVNVPGRGLTALITFKRNTDASLPASHLIEIVFAVPPGFEGGAIDSVQRIAMKQTEQDRGDALIAVPAKITDDFHMIALNDFPDARATNLELLRTRNWMDVPLAYRNGRRALLTLQKGEEGTQAFNDAIREWQQLSSNSNSGQ